MDDQNSIKTDGIHEENRLIQDRTVIALFVGQDDARSAEQALIEAGFDMVNVAWNGDETADQAQAEHHQGIWSSIKAFFGGHKDTELYGEGLRRGQTLVTVHTEQGRAATAVEILDRYNPTDVEGAEQAWSGNAETGLPIGAKDIPAEDRPAYASAAAEMDETPVSVTSVPVTTWPTSAGRDSEAGNGRIRSYYPRATNTGDNGEDADIALRDDDSILSDTDEDALLGNEDERVRLDKPTGI